MILTTTSYYLSKKKGVLGNKGFHDRQKIRRIGHTVQQTKVVRAKVKLSACSLANLSIKFKSLERKIFGAKHIAKFFGVILDEHK